MGALTDEELELASRGSLVRPCPAGKSPAFQRGWEHSKTAYDARALQPVEDRYDYLQGWFACADVRWGRAALAKGAGG